MHSNLSYARKTSSSSPRADAIDELADLEIEHHVASNLMPLHHLAAWMACSAAAIDLAEDASDELVYELLSRRVRTIEPLVPECGALNQWRREVAAGYRKITNIDVLSRAAIHEANARDELRFGLQRAACKSRLTAAALIVDHGLEQAA